jgi:hypothetical protein
VYYEIYAKNTLLFSFWILSKIFIIGLQ